MASLNNRNSPLNSSFCALVVKGVNTNKSSKRSRLRIVNRSVGEIGCTKISKNKFISSQISKLNVTHYAKNTRNCIFY